MQLLGTIQMNSKWAVTNFDIIALLLSIGYHD